MEPVFGSSTAGVLARGCPYSTVSAFGCVKINTEHHLDHLQHATVERGGMGDM